MTSAGNIIFKGIDGNECEEFVAALEELAFTEGWSQDRERMLLFARSRLRKRALRWFSQLDPSVQNDWNLFVQALFAQYPPVEAWRRDGTLTPVWSTTTWSPGSTSTTISNLPSDPQANTRDQLPTAQNGRLQSTLPSPRAYNPSSLGRHIGVLRIVVDEEPTPSQYFQYIWHGHRQPYYNLNGSSQLREQEPLGTTIDRREALIVCFVPSPEPHPIGCLNTTRGMGDLSLAFTSTGVDSYELRAANGIGKPSEGGTLIENVSSIWNILANGSLQASLGASPVFQPTVSNSSAAMRFGGLFADLRGDPSPYHTASTTSANWEPFQTVTVHLDTSGTSVSFVKPGTALRQDDPRRNNGLGRFELKAVSLVRFTSNRCRVPDNESLLRAERALQDISSLSFFKLPWFKQKKSQGYSCNHYQQDTGTPPRANAVNSEQPVAHPPPTTSWRWDSLFNRANGSDGGVNSYTIKHSRDENKRLNRERCDQRCTRYCDNCCGCIEYCCSCCGCGGSA